MQSRMSIRHPMGYLATALVSVAAGWSLQSAPTAPPATTATATVATSASRSTGLAAAQQFAQSDGKPQIIVSSDGNVTLHVEQQPLEWVLEQIARQSGWRDVKARAGASGAPVMPTAAAAETACPEAPVLTSAQSAQLLQSIQRGSEPDRYQSLIRAHSDGGGVPDELLKQVYETDASERVRLLAFEAYLEPRSGDTSALRGALQSALYVPNAAIQHEARKRLEELAESDRMDAANLQPASP